MLLDESGVPAMIRSVARIGVSLWPPNRFPCQKCLQTGMSGASVWSFVNEQS